MRFYSYLIVIFFCALTFKGHSQQPGEDSLKTEVASGEEVDSEALKRAGDCPNARQKGDTITLVFLIKPFSKHKQDEFCKTLSADGLMVTYQEYFNETDVPSVWVQLTKDQFAQLFQGTLDYKLEKECTDKSVEYCQMKVEHYKIPEKYKHKIFSIQAPLTCTF